MKTFIKFAAVGIAGYFIGFYEMKYKVVKAIVEGYVERESEDSKNENVEES